VRFGPFVAASSFEPLRKKEVPMSSVLLTRTVTVNAAFLQEIKEVNQELWQQLEEMRHRCQRPIAPANCRQLVQRLSQLRDHLALHFALEEAYGYFDDPVDVAPRLGYAAEQLRSEHRELYMNLTGVVERAERLLHTDQMATLALWVGPQFLRFDESLRDHEARENELIFDAFDTDIGAGD
jgi:hypothetical protein